MTAVPTGIAPVFLVRDMELNIDFWTNKVGFNVERYGEPTHHAILYRGNARIMLSLTSANAKLTPNWKIHEKTCDAFIWVDDAKAMYAQVIERGAQIDWELYKAPWGGLEFGIQDPEGRDIAIGQILQEDGV
ncbi:MAG: VOC family protein [Pseudomonadota bacterium]